MPAFDQDKARAARAEKAGPPPEITVGGKTFTLAPAPSVRVMELIRDLPDKPADDASDEAKKAYGAASTASQLEIMAEVFGPEQWAAYRAHAHPDQNDLNDIIEYAFEQWGTSTGESEASAVSSNNGSRRPRQPSPQRTG